MRRPSSWRKSWGNASGELAYSFFSDSGSVAVEVALKMALQYFMNRGQTRRTMILALEHAYHGDTFKTMEAGDDADYHFVLQATDPAGMWCTFPRRFRRWRRPF